MEYIECLNVCLENARTPQGKILMEKMRSDVQWYHENFQDDPQRLSGWGHQYFCADDGAFLQFSRTSPRGHRCPICGKVYDADNYNSAWVYLYRYEALMSALEAAGRRRTLSGTLPPYCRFLQRPLRRVQGPRQGTHDVRQWQDHASGSQ